MSTQMTLPAQSGGAPAARAVSTSPPESEKPMLMTDEQMPATKQMMRPTFTEKRPAFRDLARRAALFALLENARVAAQGDAREAYGESGDDRDSTGGQYLLGMERDHGDERSHAQNRTEEDGVSERETGGCYAEAETDSAHSPDDSPERGHDDVAGRCGPVDAEQHGDGDEGEDDVQDDHAQHGERHP